MRYTQYTGRGKNGRAFLLHAAGFLPPALWYGVIWHFSAQPASVSGAFSDRLLYRVLVFFSEAFRALPEGEQRIAVEALSFWERKLAHMFLYFLLAALFLHALRKLIALPQTRAAAVLTLCGLCAAVDEYHQTFVPGRSGELRDVCVDGAGAVCFLLLWALWRYLRRRRAP